MYSLIEYNIIITIGWGFFIVKYEVYLFVTWKRQIKIEVNQSPYDKLSVGFPNVQNNSQVYNKKGKEKKSF